METPKYYVPLTPEGWKETERLLQNHVPQEDIYVQVSRGPDDIKLETWIPVLKRLETHPDFLPMEEAKRLKFPDGEPEFPPPTEEEAREVDKIYTKIFRMYGETLPQDPRVLEDTIRRVCSRFLTLPENMTCEQIAAQNLTIRRIIFGDDFDEVAGKTSLRAKTIRQFESGKRSIPMYYNAFVVTCLIGYKIHPKSACTYGFAFRELFPWVSGLPAFQDLASCDHIIYPAGMP